MTNPASLRAVLATLTIAVALLSALVACALVVLTTALHRTTDRSASSVESVRLAEEAEIGLLLHERASDPLVKGDIEGELLRLLRDAGAFVTTDEEARVLADARRSTETYLAAARESDGSPGAIAEQLQPAYQSLDRLVAINVDDARRAQLDAARWNDVANLLGIAVGGAVLAFAAVFLWWLRARAFRPIMDLASTMQRFAGGDREARAAEAGPSEIRGMCVRFNEMASSIATQRQAQMTFLGGVAHDLRSPLNVLRLSVGLLEGDGRLSEERIRKTIERIGRQTARMDRMLGDLLDVTRIEAGQLELQLETHDARRIVEEVVDQFHGDPRGHSISVRTPDRAVAVCCDRLRVEQVLSNLLSNAIKYSPPGGPIDVTLEFRGEEGAFSVSDRGAGIPATEQERIFEPFRRLHRSDAPIPGAGLGLFVVRRIVEAHCGRIEVDSAIGEGSTFRFVLPLAHDRDAEPPAPSMAPALIRESGPAHSRT